MDEPKELRAASLEEVRARGAIPVTVAGTRLLIAAVGADVVAVEDRCTHQDTPLAGGRVRNGRISCPLHGAMFDLRTGKGLTPIAPRPLRTFAVAVRGDDVFVGDPALSDG